MKMQSNENKRSTWKVILFCVFVTAAFALESGAVELQTKLAEVNQTAGASVVNITSKVMVPNIQNLKIPRKGTGSGFVYDDQGHIVTNYHVVQNASRIMVSLDKDEMHEAELVGSDPSTDLAVLKIKDKDVKLKSSISVGGTDRFKRSQFERRTS